MKKQINPTIKAHLLRSALFVPLLVAICAIPFALAQQTSRKNSTNHTVAGEMPAVQSADGVFRATQAVPNLPSGPPPTCTPGAWVPVAPLPTDLYGAAIGSDGTFIYAAGGYSFSASNSLNQFSRYDLVANTWTPLASIPAGGDAAEPLGVYAPNVNRFYFFGGAQGPSLGTILNTNRYYDFGTNTWGTGLVMPGVRAQMAGGYYNGKIYLVGGYDTPGVTPLAQVWEYDPVANTYDTTRLNLPQALGGPGYGIINGHLYVAGGRDASNTNRNILYDYDIAANTWTQRANLPTGVNVPASGVAQGLLVISGGGNPFLGANGRPAFPRGETPFTTNISQIYNPATDTWTSGPNLPQALAFATGGGIGSNVLVAGGYNGTTTVADAELLALSCAPTVTSAVSRKVHGTAGTFDINLPLTGSPGIEDRCAGSGCLGGTNNYTMVVTFSDNVTVTGTPQAEVISGTGCVGSGGVCMGGNNVTVSGAVVTIPLTNVTDVQTINVRLNGVNSAADAPAVDVVIPMSIHVGDVNLSGSVNSSDIVQTKIEDGHVVGAGNFTKDVLANGQIDSNDIVAVKFHTGL